VLFKVGMMAPLLIVLARSAGAPPIADVVLHGGTVYTMDPRQPVAEAVAISTGRFIAVGATNDVMATKGPATEIIDLRGATVVPGFQDAHGHVGGLGASLHQIDLRDVSSLDDVVTRVREAARAARPDTWITGRGWDQNRWTPPTWPTAAALDRAAPNHPVWLTRVDGHAGVANSVALQRAGITAATLDPAGGRIIRGEGGRPVGVLVDAAQRLVAAHVPPPGHDEIVDDLLRADRKLSSVGLTMVHDAGVSPTVIEVYRELVADGRLHTRFYVMVRGGEADAWFSRGPLIDPEHRLDVRAIKLVADGALGSRGAALLEDYADEPGNRGLLVTPADVLYARARAAVDAGFQVAIHAIGDRANREVLDLFERLEREVPGARALRLRNEHAQVLDRTDIPRFHALGVIASMQATHCTSDMPWAPARLGPARVAEGAYVWRTLLDTDVVLANGSDFPVERPDPLLGFYAALTRQDTTGQPPGGWNPSQRLTRDQALRSFTLAAAFAAHAEHELGSIEAGKLGDLVVLSRDIMKVPAREVLSTTVLRTMVAGRTVYQADPQ
jgi:predicted amidohydrolase YtcJ